LTRKTTYNWFLHALRYLCVEVVKLKLGTGCKSSGNGALACHAAETLS
jgi:hypothetical protein